MCSVCWTLVLEFCFCGSCIVCDRRVWWCFCIFALVARALRRSAHRRPARDAHAISHDVSLAPISLLSTKRERLWMPAKSFFGEFDSRRLLPGRLLIQNCQTTPGSCETPRGNWGGKTTLQSRIRSSTPLPNSTGYLPKQPQDIYPSSRR